MRIYRKAAEWLQAFVKKRRESTRRGGVGDFVLKMRYHDQDPHGYTPLSSLAQQLQLIYNLLFQSCYCERLYCRKKTDGVHSAGTARERSVFVGSYMASNI